MRSKSKKLVVLLLIAIAIPCYQNCSSGGFSTINSTSANSSLGSGAPVIPPVIITPPVQTPAPSLTPIITQTPTPTPDPNTRKVNMVVLYGDADTTTVSCDGGASWFYHSFNADHLQDGDGPYSSTSLTYSQGYMYLMKGWGGSPATVSRSSDGITWQKVYAFPVNNFYSGLAVLGNIFIVADGGDYQRSTDSGKTFAKLAFDGGSRHLHSMTYEHNGTKLLMIGDGIITSSADGGLTWKVSYSPAVGENSCAEIVAFGGGTLVAMGQQGDVCKSTDDGATWIRVGKLNGGFYNHKLVWNGTKFIAYPGNQSTAYTSADATNWTSVPMTNFSPFNQSVIYFDPVSKMYYAYRTANTFYKSTDGLNWVLLAPAAQPPNPGGSDYMQLFAQGEMTIQPGHPCYK